MRILNQRIAVRCALAVVAMLVLLMLPCAARAIDFVFNFTDPDGQGFNDPVKGPQEQAAIIAAGAKLGHLIQSTYLGETVTVNVSSFSDSTSTVLASAKPASYYGNFGSSDPRYQSDTQYPKALADSLADHDVQSDHVDMTMKVNMSQPFYFGTDGKPPSIPVFEYDFITVAMHEMIHGIGFSASLRQDGSYGLFGDGTYDPNAGVSGFAVPFDRFVSLGGSSSSLVFQDPSQTNRSNDLIGGNIYWSGPLGTLGNGGTPIKLYAPDPWIDGSSISHTDPTAQKNDPQGPNYTVANQMPSPAVRGILADMGWNTGILSASRHFTANGGNNLASNNANWDSPPSPGDTLVFGANAANVYNVLMDNNLPSLAGINFSNSAPSHTLEFSYYTDLWITGAGVTNDSPNAQTVVLDSSASRVGNADIDGRAAHLTFQNSSTAGTNVSYELNGGFSIVTTPPAFDRYDGARIDFYNTSTAGSATFTAQGAAGDGAPSTFAGVSFHDASTAGSATITNQPGRFGVGANSTNVDGWGAETNFADSASAGSAIFNNLGQSTAGTGNVPSGTGGITNFYNSSTANEGTFNNMGASVVAGLGGTTQFHDTSTADHSTIINNTSQVGTAYTLAAGTTGFFDTSTAGNSNITNVGGNIAGFTAFHNSSTAGSATITNQQGAGNFAIGGHTYFYDTSVAGSSTINNKPGGFGLDAYIEFFNSSTAGTAHITNTYVYQANGGSTTFTDTSSADHSVLTDQGGEGTIQFQSHSTADHATIVLENGGYNQARLNFLDNSTAANSTITIGQGGNAQFSGQATAGNANMNVVGGDYTTGGGYGGTLSFLNGSIATAANAVINVDGGSSPAAGGSSVYFGTGASAGGAMVTAYGGSAPPAGGIHTGGASITLVGAHAGNSTLIAYGGTNGGDPASIKFQQAATGDTARIVVNAGAYADFSGNQAYLAPSNTAATTVGSLEGAGDIYLGSGLLSVGTLNTNTTFSGVIHDGPNGLAGGQLTKVGTGSLALTNTQTYTGMTTVDAGELIVTGHLPGSFTVNPAGTLKGAANIAGTIINNGTIAPGDDPAIMHAGSLISTSNAAYDFERTTAANDEIIVDGNLTLAGTITFTYPNGYTLGHAGQPLFEYGGTLTNNGVKINTVFHGGSSTDFVLSMFATSIMLIEKPILGDANADGIVDSADLSAFQYGHTHALSGWNNGDFNQDGVVNQNDLNLFEMGLVQYDAEHHLVPGDYNGNGATDAADYAVWRKGLGINYGPVDYDLWRMNFGQTGGSGAGATANAAVPEPATLVLLIIAAVGWFPRPRRVA